MKPVRVLVVDNYDSFVYTIAGYLTQLGAECVVRRNDEVELKDADGYDGILLSPVRGPKDAGSAPRWCCTAPSASSR